MDWLYTQRVTPQEQAEKLCRLAFGSTRPGQDPVKSVFCHLRAMELDIQSHGPLPSVCKTGIITPVSKPLKRKIV